MALPFGLALGADVAEPWVARSLRQGTPLAIKVSEGLWSPGVAVLFVPPEFKGRQVQPLAKGKYVKTSDSIHVADEFLAWFRARSAKTLIVESDVQRRGDRLAHGADVAFVGNRVVRWVDLDVGGDQASELLRRGATGHPLNAYVCRDSAADLGLAAEEEVSDQVLEGVVASLLAVVVAVFDAESFVAWLRPDSGIADAVSEVRRIEPLTTPSAH